MVAAERPWPLPEHLSHGSHRLRRGQPLVVGWPVVAESLPVGFTYFAVYPNVGVEILPRLRGHHDGPLTGNRFQQGFDDCLRAAADVAEATQ